MNFLDIIEGHFLANLTAWKTFYHYLSNNNMITRSKVERCLNCGKQIEYVGVRAAIAELIDYQPTLKIPIKALSKESDSDPSKTDG